MTVILDTCALLWWSLEPDSFSETAKLAIEEMEKEKDGITSAMAIWEIAIKVKNNKLNLGIPLDVYVSKLKQSDVVSILPIEEDLLIQSVNLEWSHRDPVDRIMTALALQEGCPIVTKDRDIREFYTQAIW